MQRQMEMVKTLLQLIAENPDLPVIPLVYSEIVGDNCGYWRGEFSESKVCEGFVSDITGEFFIRSNDFNSKYDAVDSKFYADDMTDDEIESAYERLPWQKHIVVYIDLPQPSKEV